MANAAPIDDIVPSGIVLVPHVRIIQYNVYICRNMHSTRANFHLSLNMDVHTWRHDLVEVRYTFTLDNIIDCEWLG